MAEETDAEEVEEVYHMERPMVQLPPQPGNRVTVTETVYHSAAQNQPTSIASGFSYSVESDEQPYCRTMKIGEDWTPLDLGFLADEAGMIVVRNEEGTLLRKRPSDDEKEATAAKVLELSGAPNDVACWLIHPGRSFRGFPSAPKNLFLRSRSGEIRCTLFITPR